MQDGASLRYRHLTQLDENYAARPGPRRMPAARRVTNVGASRIIAMLIGKNAINDKKFLP